MQRSKTKWQGRRDLNPQPPVLETGALPIEPLPFEPNNPRRLSDAQRVLQGGLPTGVRNDKIRELQDRLNILNTQIRYTIDYNLGAVIQGVPEFLLRERNDLRRRLQDESNQPVPAGPSPSIAI